MENTSFQQQSFREVGNIDFKSQLKLHLTQISGNRVSYFLIIKPVSKITNVHREIGLKE